MGLTEDRKWQMIASEHEDRATESTYFEEHREKRLKKNSISGLIEQYQRV